MQEGCGAPEGAGREWARQMDAGCGLRNTGRAPPPNKKESPLNNRNNNNRRRGRGNRQQGSGPVNRIDSRARGNAPQMLDKYKKLAQDAQHNGDRVQAEYYLQFADHYYRVLADSRLRQEESRARQGDQRSDQRHQADDDGDSDDTDNRNEGRDTGDNYRQVRGRDNRGRQDNRSRPDNRSPQDEQGQRGRFRDNEDEAEDASAGDEDAAERPAPRGRARTAAPRTPRAPRGRANGSGGNGAAEIDAAVLPPAFASSGNEEDERPAPRRRRTAKADGPADDAAANAA